MHAECVPCRLCGATRTRRLGVLTDSDVFAGRVLRDPLPGGHLWSCTVCRSMFRHPVLPDSAYLRLYADGVADEWGTGEGRQDVAIIRHLIAGRADAVSVLDVGCGAGDFLATLPAHVFKCGVEPSVAASALASVRDVSILAATLDGLSADARFDFITMIDVIEHVAAPTALLDAATRHLRPGGSLLISTGDAGHILWRRVFKARFWYSSFPEHISFPSLAYFDLWRKKRGLNAPQALRFKYQRLAFWKSGLSLASQLAYFTSPTAWNHFCRILGRLHRVPVPHRRFFPPGGSGVFTDHHVVQIRLPP